MRKIVWTIVALLALITLASTALAQDGGGYLPVGATYEVRFQAQASSERVCLYKVETVPAVRISDSNPIACTTDLVADGATANTMRFEVSPGLTADQPVAALAERVVNGNTLTSGLSNWRTLIALLGAPVLLP